MAKPIRLSKAARDLLRRRANSERVDVTPANLETYRELARAGIMEPFSGFMRGPEAVFRFTQRRLGTAGGASALPFRPLGHASEDFPGILSNGQFGIRCSLNHFVMRDALRAASRCSWAMTASMRSRQAGCLAPRHNRRRSGARMLLDIPSGRKPPRHLPTPGPVRWRARRRPLVCQSNRALRAEDRPWQAVVGTVAAHGAVICWRPQPGGKGSGERGGVAPCG